jgi:hypothetical protein
MQTLPRFRNAALAGLLIVASPMAVCQGFSVVVHPSNPVSAITVPALRAIFNGAVTRWPNQSKIVLAERTQGSPANRFLMDRFLKTSWQDYKRSLEELEFMGQEAATIRVLNSDAAACKFVFNVPTAVAMVESVSTAEPDCRDLRVVKIDGLLPGQGGYRLK